jgi:hypothetical protein
MENNEKEKYYCRKCMKSLPEDNFYQAMDGGLVDSNTKFSVCKNCVQDIFDIVYKELNSMEKTVHRLCQIFNIKFTNEALDATKSHIQTMLENGKNVKAIFSIYLMKLTATKKSMNKGGVNDFQYEDVGTIFTEKQIDTSSVPMPMEIVKFWGNDLSRGDIEFLENEYTEFKNTHSADTRAEVVLLKQVCYTLLNIKKARLASDPTDKLVKELQDLMKSLTISPNVAKSNALNAGGDSYGQWIADIERSEPSQWLLSDPRGQIYRDVGDTDSYFEKYIVRPLRGFITGSRDFNVDENEEIEREFDDREVNNFVNLDEEIN